MDLDLDTFGDVGDREYVGEVPSDVVSRLDVFTGGGFRSGWVGGGVISAGRVGDAEFGRGPSETTAARTRPRSGDREKGDFPRSFDGDRVNRAFATDS